METEKIRYGVGMFVMKNNERRIGILERYQRIEELEIGYVSWFNKFNERKIKVNLYMVKFNENGTARILEDIMRELSDEIIMAKLIGRHFNN